MMSEKPETLIALRYHHVHLARILLNKVIKEAKHHLSIPDQENLNGNTLHKFRENKIKVGNKKVRLLNYACEYASLNYACELFSLNVIKEEEEYVKDIFGTIFYKSEKHITQFQSKLSYSLLKLALTNEKNLIAITGREDNVFCTACKIGSHCFEVDNEDSIDLKKLFDPKALKTHQDFRYPYVLLPAMAFKNFSIAERSLKDHVIPADSHPKNIVIGGFLSRDLWK